MMFLSEGSSDYVDDWETGASPEGIAKFAEKFRVMLEMHYPTSMHHTS